MARPRLSGTLCLRIDDADVTVVIHNSVPEHTQFRILGRDSVEYLRNKTITSTTNNVSANSITSDGVVYPISGTPILGDSLVLTVPGALSWLPAGSGVVNSNLFTLRASPAPAPAISITTVATAARSVVFPDGAGNVVIDTLAQTLTNKTIAFGSNTITGLPVSSYGQASYVILFSDTLPNITETIVNFNNALATDSGVSNSSGTFTISRTGVYVISATVAFVANATGYRTIYFRINGGPQSFCQVSASGDAGYNTGLNTTFSGILTAGDNIRVIAAQTSGAPLTISGYYTFGGKDVTMIQIARIS